MNTANTEIRSFYSPFEKGYWRCAASEFGNPRTIVVAAMITALRIVIQGVSIPIIPNVLYISLGFFANALGSMIYGPLVGLVSGAISEIKPLAWQPGFAILLAAAILCLLSAISGKPYIKFSSVR